MFADIPAGVDFQTTLQPQFWAHQASDFKPLDLIEMMCEDGTWEAMCRVMHVGKVEVSISTIYYVEHESASEIDNDEYEVKYISPSVRYAVRRIDTQETLKDHFQTIMPVVRPEPSSVLPMYIPGRF